MDDYSTSLRIEKGQDKEKQHVQVALNLYNVKFWRMYDNDWQDARDKDSL
jgi:hypothetical protein